MKKVLIIGPLPNPISGVSLSNKIVCEILKKSKYFEVETINTSYPLFEDKIGSFTIKKLLFYLVLNFKCIRVLKSEIVYITPGQTFFGVLKYFVFITLASISNKELIIHVHGNHLGKEYKQLLGLKKKIFFFLMSKFNKGIVLSTSLKTNLSPFLKEENIFIVYNFAEEFIYQEQKTIEANCLKIIYLSNLMEEKGILYLLDALKKLERLGIAYEAKIAGNIDDTLKTIIENKIRNLKNTTYIGVVKGNAKKELLNWSNIFVLPTFYKMEGQPISILEALATQNVIITTNHAGISDIITDNVNGFIVKTKSADRILEKFVFLDNNKEEITNICVSNKEYFLKNYTIEKFSNSIKKVFNASPESREI